MKNSLYIGLKKSPLSWGQKSNVMQLLRLFFQIFPEVRVGDIDQLGGALADGFTVQIGHAIFSYDIAHMISGRHNTGAMLEQGSDLAQYGSISHGIRAG